MLSNVHHPYLLFRVGTRPKNEHNPAAIVNEATIVMTALNASPIFDFTISILAAV